jgi:hypothetical protein
MLESVGNHNIHRLSLFLFFFFLSFRRQRDFFFSGGAAAGINVRHLRKLLYLRWWCCRSAAMFVFQLLPPAAANQSGCFWPDTSGVGLARFVRLASSVHMSVRPNSLRPARPITARGMRACIIVMHTHRHLFWRWGRAAESVRLTRTQFCSRRYPARTPLAPADDRHRCRDGAW